jgi:4-hydroxybenzoate polyprenyltransferase
MKNYLSLIKFSHTIFALPFAMIGFFLAVFLTRNGEFLSDIWLKMALVLLCMVFARSAAMAFNRYIDRDIDAKNPRTVTREIPAGVISPPSALYFVVANVLLFIATTYFINPLCFFLSPIALIIVLGYSYTKRFTAFCHLVLGLGLALAPIGAYIAVTAEFALIPILYSLVVLLWVAGFDIIYALQDESFDKSLQLHSIPTWLGAENALRFSEILHLGAAIMVLAAAYFGGFGWLHWIAAFIFIGLLIYQHLLVKPNDLSKVDLAFFTTNGVASVIFGVLVILDLVFL